MLRCPPHIKNAHEFAGQLGGRSVDRHRQVLVDRCVFNDFDQGLTRDAIPDLARRRGGFLFHRKIMTGKPDLSKSDVWPYVFEMHR